jgi:hypothetical protein
VLSKRCPCPATRRTELTLVTRAANSLRSCERRPEAVRRYEWKMTTYHPSGSGPPAGASLRSSSRCAAAAAFKSAFTPCCVGAGMARGTAAASGFGPPKIAAPGNSGLKLSYRGALSILRNMGFSFGLWPSSTPLPIFPRERIFPQGHGLPSFACRRWRTKKGRRKPVTGHSDGRSGPRPGWRP